MPERVDTPEAFLALRVRLRDQHVLLVQAQAARNQADARAYALKLDLAAVRQQRDDLAAENARFKEEATTSLDARAATIETLEAENTRLKVLADQAEKYCQEARALREHIADVEALKGENARLKGQNFRLEQDRDTARSAANANLATVHALDDKNALLQKAFVAAAYELSPDQTHQTCRVCHNTFTLGMERGKPFAERIGQHRDASCVVYVYEFQMKAAR